MADLALARGRVADGKSASVEFLHYGDMTNVGDYLSSPRHYFDFDCARRTVIVGGGASNNFFAKRALQKRGVRVVWGVGQSWPFGREMSTIDGTLKYLLRRVTYAKASTRDPALASPILPLVPCVSVFHPITETPPGRETGVIVNGSERVSGDIEALRHRLATTVGGEIVFATNTIDLDDFEAAFARTRTLITNSFHAAYWGLLSGRAVHIIGYSSKFTNLARLFGYLPNAVEKVARGDGADLAAAIARCHGRAGLQLKDPAATRHAFRRMNLDFAESLLQVGVSATLNRNSVRQVMSDGAPSDAVKAVLTPGVGTCAGSASVPVAALCPGSSSSRYSGSSPTPS
jgi:hypothetical protein